METKVFRWSLHKALWYWLAENPDKSKCDWIGWRNNGGTIGYVQEYCFACDYDSKECEDCPLKWTSDRCYLIMSEYRLWDRCKDLEYRAGLALAIAELPVKEGIICV